MRDLFNERQAKINEYLNHRNKLPNSQRKDIPDNIFIKCDSCGHVILKEEFEKQLNVCPNCNFHAYIKPRQRILNMCDSFQEINQELITKDNGFPGYKEKLIKAEEISKENEAILTGIAKINDIEFALGIMNSQFMMGSMGSVLGEKVARLAEISIQKKIPLVIFCASGGARMQEEIISLMQMAKTTAIISKLKSMNLGYITIITNPTYGGVSASFASLGDITIAEPKANFGFAGRRVIANTIKEELPTDFQSVETSLKQGMIDMIINRKDLRKVLYDLMSYLG